jgi:alkanesulfonate monooxygenase SsuD/methylene tetrahydromethanopterin reductase-like flavin-dependent oxidoreductase (luciferase family)
MDLGIGLPNAIPGTTGKQLTDFARAADEAGFSTLGTIDRVVYDNYEPVVALSAAAAVTERIRLATTVILGPIRFNPVLVAKQILSLDAVAGGGRAVLGIAIGAREDDYEVSDQDMSTRGEWLDTALPVIRKVWSADGEKEGKIGPQPRNGGPSLILGGGVDASFERTAQYGDGWMMGGGPPDQFAESLPKLEAAWKEQGRDGDPKKMALGYFSLGPNAVENARHDLIDYYSWLGEETAKMIADSTPTDPEQVQGAISAFESIGCDELVLFPCSSDPEQVTLLADAAGL